MWVFIRLLALVVLFGTAFPVESPSREEKQDDCSIGEVDEELTEDDRLEVGGIYFLPHSADCNGNLTSWYTCFLYSDLQTHVEEYRMSLRVYRRNQSGNVYTVTNATRVTVTRKGNDTMDCKNVSLDEPIHILEGDRIGLQVDSQCMDERRRPVCPLHPNLKRSAGSPVFHLPDRNDRDPIAVSLVENETYYTDVSINVRASIVGASSMGGGLSRGEIAGVIVGPALLLLILILVHVLLIVLLCRQLKTKQSTYITVHTRDNYDPRFGGKYHAYADASPGQSYEDPDHLLNGKRTSYRERFRNRMYSGSNAYSLVGRAEEDIQGDISVRTISTDLESTCHYEYSNESPYWQPATVEDELRQQLLQLHITEVSTEELKIGEHLGSGQFGTVINGVWEHSELEIEVAVKLLKSGSTEEERVKFLQEAAIMGQFNHPNILKIYGAVTLSEPLMILSEMMHKGDLHHYLLSITPTYGDSDLPALLLSFCRQVAAGMGYLAHKSFVHRDLAARNILVSADDVCKIADFGLSRDLQNEDFYISRGGKIPVKWTAPEALNFRKYSTASDVWSYGILLYEIWALGRKPYHDSTNFEVLNSISSGCRLPPPSGCPKAVYQLMLQCWHPEAESRPTFFDILLVLQRPDFQLLKWNPEDEAAYSQEARTLGNVAEVGKELYAELQSIYLSATPEDPL